MIHCTQIVLSVFVVFDLYKLFHLFYWYVHKSCSSLYILLISYFSTFRFKIYTLYPSYATCNASSARYIFLLFFYLLYRSATSALCFHPINQIIKRTLSNFWLAARHLIFLTSIYYHFQVIISIEISPIFNNLSLNNDIVQSKKSTQHFPVLSVLWVSAHSQDLL